MWSVVTVHQCHVCGDTMPSADGRLIGLHKHRPKSQRAQPPRAACGVCGHLNTPSSSGRIRGHYVRTAGRPRCHGSGAVVTKLADGSLLGERI